MINAIKDIFSGIPKAFNKSTLDYVTLGNTAIEKSVARNSKRIINSAIMIDSVNRKLSDGQIKVFADESLEKLVNISKNKNASVDDLLDHATGVANFMKTANDSVGENEYTKLINGFYNDVEKMRKYSSSAKTMSDMEEYLGREKGSGIGILKTAEGFFRDKTYGKSRIAATAGIYSVASVGARYLLGGNLKTNPNGERDIAGIPFF